MPNKYFEDFSGPAVKKARKAFLADMPVKDVNWPGLPGKKQPKDRTGGIKKLRIYPTSEGL